MRYVQWAPIPKKPWGVHEADGRLVKRFDTAARAYLYLLQKECTTMSRYDYPDPGQDPAYCDGLAADDDLEIEAGPLDDRGRGEGYCLWCGVPLTNAVSDYCSSLCAVAAEVDSE